jgi:hypothetical protein
MAGDAKVKRRVPKNQPKMPLDMPATMRDFKGRFRPRTERGTPTSDRYTKSGVLPPVQPRRKPVLRGVYED